MASLPKREDVNLMLEADKPHFFKIILQDSIRGGKLMIGSIPNITINLEKRYYSIDALRALDFAATEGNEEQRLDGVMVRKQSLTAEEKANSLQRANINFKSENPFFIIAMQPSYVHPGKKLAIPNAFSRKYFKQKRGAAALSTFEGKTWSAEFYYIVHKGRTSAKLLNGWKKFAQENHLEVGDVCAFELINQTKITFKITIFRHDQGNKKQPVGEKSNSREKFIQEYPSCSNLCVAIKAAKEFTSIHPFFKAVITASHLGRANVHVPHDFLSEMQQSKEKAKLQVGNRRWDVKLNLYANKMKHRGVLSAGWCQFARENSVQVGDVCVFELIDNQAVVMKVSIFRNVQ
ncbi:B3 domain-containing protein REM6 [Jatropha curcas]|uniref:B3 domain-containing protein REM6 n=1 Tax=Jatropha curcas TaxID=180498 RepID=UPI0018946A46|nr:B3 domain-containing protein REM6 [Jatropha curcas]